MYAGRIVEVAATTKLFTAPRHPYSAGLLHAAPFRPRRRTVWWGSRGGRPAPGQWPQGCAYAPRCAFAEDDCRERCRPVTDSAAGTGAVLPHRSGERRARSGPRGRRRRHERDVDVVLTGRRPLRRLRRQGGAARDRRRGPPQRVRGARRRVGQRQDDARALRRRAAQGLHGRGALGADVLPGRRARARTARARTSSTSSRTRTPR